MPDIVSLWPVLSASALATLVIDCFAVAKQTADTESNRPVEGRLSDFVLFTPFIALYYHEAFWINLLFTLPLIVIAVLAQGLLYKRGYLKTPPEVWVMMPGPYLLSIIGYFMFFREGILTQPSLSSDIENVESATSSDSTVFWPYIVGLIFFLFTIFSRRADSIFLSVLFFIPAITILPFFTGYYWWSMLAGLILFLLSINRVFKVLNRDQIGGASIISGYFYVMAAFGSMVFYAIFY